MRFCWRETVFNRPCRCRMLTRPDSSRPCDVACPQDCLTSAWSTWSTCGGADALDEAGATQTRMRRVVQAPADGGVACAALVEKRSCLDWLQRRRQRLRWHLGPWSPCRLTAESACGDGIMTRGTDIPSTNISFVVNRQFQIRSDFTTPFCPNGQPQLASRDIPISFLVLGENMCRKKVS